MKPALSQGHPRTNREYSRAHKAEPCSWMMSMLCQRSPSRDFAAVAGGGDRTIGNSRVRRADVRIISTCNQDLHAVNHGHQFREDLYHRLAAVTLTVPPLRERHLDIPSLATHFLKTYSEHYRKPCLRFSRDAMQALSVRVWRGNIRELEHTVSRAVLFADGVQIEVAHLRLPQRGPSPITLEFTAAKHENNERFERTYIENVLALHKGNITKAARAAGSDRRSFHRLMVKHGIDPASYRPESEGNE